MEKKPSLVYGLENKNQLGCNNNKKKNPGEFPQVGSGQGSVYVGLTPTLEEAERMFPIRTN